MSKWYQLQHGQAFVAPRRSTYEEAVQDAVSQRLAKILPGGCCEFPDPNIRIVSGRSTNTARKRADELVQTKLLPTFVTRNIGSFEPGKLYEKYLETIRTEAASMTGLLLSKRSDLTVEDIELLSYRCERNPNKIIFRVQVKDEHHERV